MAWSKRRTGFFSGSGVYETPIPYHTLDFGTKSPELVDTLMKTRKNVSPKLEGHKQELLAQMTKLTVEAINTEHVSEISACINTWENISFDDKWWVVV